MHRPVMAAGEGLKWGIFDFGFLILDWETERARFLNPKSKIENPKSDRIRLIYTPTSINISGYTDDWPPA
jgi:hypothetical protein